MTREQRNAAILHAIETHTRRALQSKEYARQMLIDEGIYTKDGELMPEFGGPTIEAKST